MIDIWKNAFQAAEKALVSLKTNDKLINDCSDLGNALVKTFQQGGKVFICGNGGSHCDALHFAEEWTGRYRKDRKPLPVMALGEATHTTCVANDFGFDKVFSRQLEAFGKKEDLLITLTTSGNSKNILEVLSTAKTLSIPSWGMLGKDGGKAISLCNSHILVPGETTDRIQELHMMILHISIEHAERILFPSNY